jgi:hypothetical protein
MNRLSALLETLRPRTMARTIKGVDDLVAVSRELKRLPRLRYSPVQSAAERRRLPMTRAPFAIEA